MTTKDNIILASVKLFNRRGVSRVSLRQIAGEAGISHGNLAYHFKNKTRIVDEIYTRMEKEMDNVVFPGGSLSLVHYHQLFLRIGNFQKKYRFFYMDMLEITRRYPETIARYRKTVTRRSSENDQLMRHFIKKGLVKTEPGPGFYRSLFHSIWVMSTFWLQHKKILGDDHPTKATGSGIKHVWEIMLPHLTEAGLKEYRKIVGNEKSGDGPARPIQKLYLNKVTG